MIGGIHIENESIKNKDTFQLQQMILFLKSEIAKYQNEISALKKNDYESLINSLEHENSQLANQKKELSLELMKLKKSFEKEMNTLHEDIQFRETQRIKQVASIEILVKSKNDLQKENSKLTKAIKEAHHELTASKLHWSEKIEKNLIQSVKNIDNTLRNFIQTTEQHLSTIKEELLKNSLETTEINGYLLKEVKNKSNKIDILMIEIDELKEQHQLKPAPPIDDFSSLNPKILAHLDNQIQKMFSQSLNFENQLDEKLRILDDLEHKLIQLTNEIDNK